MICADGAIAWDHCVSSEDSIAQPESYGGTTQSPYTLQQTRNLLLCFGQMHVERRKSVLQSAPTLGQIGGLGIHGRNL